MLFESLCDLKVLKLRMSEWRSALLMNASQIGWTGCNLLALFVASLASRRIWTMVSRNSQQCQPFVEKKQLEMLVDLLELKFFPLEHLLSVSHFETKVLKVVDSKTSSSDHLNVLMMDD
jgi:hypothetical protein